MKNCNYIASALTEDSEIRRCLSQISDIPVDRMNYAKVRAAPQNKYVQFKTCVLQINSNFPCTSISAVSVNDSLSWLSVPVGMDMYPLNSTQSGSMFLYK